jgi:hypothetical protein
MKLKATQTEIAQLLKSEIDRLLKSANGLKCWYVPTGDATMARFALEFGAKVPRTKPLSNSELEDRANYYGEVTLYVWCSWRISKNNRVIASSKDSDKDVSAALRTLLGGKLRSITQRDPMRDMTIDFENDISLDIFCDHSRESDRYLALNWTIYVEDFVVWCGPGNTLSVKPARIR